MDYKSTSRRLASVSNIRHTQSGEAQTSDDKPGASTTKTLPTTMARAVFVPQALEIGRHTRLIGISTIDIGASSLSLDASDQRYGGLHRWQSGGSLHEKSAQQCKADDREHLRDM